MIYLIFAFVVSSWFMYFAVGFVYYSDVFFFFQAEDGIRDHCVTGVQTCALPISSAQARDNRKALRNGRRPLGPGPAGETMDERSTGSRRGEGSRLRSGAERRSLARCACARRSSRSEERRVGKECRARGARYHVKS